MSHNLGGHVRDTVR